jgi:TIR domain-containing protein
MQILESLAVRHGDKVRKIELYKGDLTELAPDEQVDILVVSAFPNSYRPIPASLIGALDRKGISVEDLEKTKRFDLRNTFSCWLSVDITNPPPGIGFKRILCFEPAARGRPPEIVGDIFRCLAPFLIGEYPDAVVAMPIVASGEQGWQGTEMLLHILNAAVHWLSQGLPLQCLRIVESSSEKVQQLVEAFRSFQRDHEAPASTADANARYDAFISYSHRDSDCAHHLAQMLRQIDGGVRIFIDRLSLNPGQSWQQEIFETLDASARIIALLSPDYLQSKVCKEEFNIALFRNREAKSDILFPIYLKTTALPTYMKMLHHIDCRESDLDKLRGASIAILRS